MKEFGDFPLSGMTDVRTRGIFKAWRERLAVTSRRSRISLAGCNEAEIATITGHSLRSVRAIIDTHYLARDPALGESTITKLKGRTKTPD